MAVAIMPTPALRGKDAIRFLDNMKKNSEEKIVAPDLPDLSAVTEEIMQWETKEKRGKR